MIYLALTCIILGTAVAAWTANERRWRRRVRHLIRGGRI